MLGNNNRYENKPRSLTLLSRVVAGAKRLLVLILIVSFGFTDLGHYLSRPYSLIPEIPRVEASTLPAIKVESFDQDVTTDGSTFLLSNDVGATSSAFIRVNSGTRKSSAGPTGSTGNTAPNVGTVGLVLTDTNQVTVERVNATAVKVVGEVWRYEGLPNGSHEFIVRDRVAVSLSGASASVSIPGVVDIDRVIPFVTGYTVNDTSANNWHFATIAAHIDDAGNLVVSRNNSGTAATVYVDVVEFTGSAWTVCHGYSNAHDTTEQTITLNTDSDGQGGSTCDINNWNTAAIIEATMEGDTAENGLSDTLALVRPGANTTSVVFDLQQDVAARNDGEAWIHVLQNDGLVVNRASDANIAEGNGTYGTATWPAGATTTAALDSLSLEWFTDTSGVGAAHMRGGLHARITDPAGTIEHWIHRSGNNVGVEYGVIELSGLTFVNTTTNVSAAGSQLATVDLPQSDLLLGGTFVISETVASRNITSITVTESGSIDGSTGLNNIKLLYDLDTSAPYDCSSESYVGTEDQFGSTDTNGFSGPNGVVSFTPAGAVSISPTQTFCGYIIYDVTDSATDGETIDISIASPATDVVVSSGGLVGPVSEVGPTGSTIARNAELTMTHYRWLNDDGVEGAATAIEAEDVPASGFANGTTRRLRVQVDAAGSTSSVPTSFRLEYATKTAATCGELSTWANVGDSGGDWDMSASANLTDGNDSTDIGTGSGGLTNPVGQTFLSPNGGLRDTNAQTGSLVLSSSNFVEFEFAIEPTVTAPQGNTYCFRVSDAGAPLRAYDVYAEGSISADVDVSASGANAVSLEAGSVGQDLGGTYIISRTGAVRTVTDITFTEIGTIDASIDLDNITLEYDIDTSIPADCSTVSNDGDESFFGSIDTDGFTAADGTVTFSGSETVGTNRSMCLYLLLDVGTGAANGETIEVQINDPSTDVVVTTASVGPSSPISPTASTTVIGQIRSQTAYHWRNDDGSESGATSASGATQNTPVLDIAKENPLRLRLQVDNAGSITTNSTQYRLEFGTKITTCDAIASWSDVGSVGGAFDMVDSVNLTDGNNTTDITLAANGAISNPGGATFLSSNTGQRDTTSQTGGLTLISSEFVELEYSLQATTDAGDATNYCFRLSDAGVPLESYISYAELTTRERQDFFIQRGSETISGTSLTLTAGIDYIAPSATSSAFVRISSSHMTGAGDNIGTNGQQADDVTAYISDQTDVTTSFTISRPPSATSNTRVDWEIIEFIGLPGTDNEMIVRDTGELSFTAAQFTQSGATVAGVADDSDVVVFITGQQNQNAGTTEYNDSLFTAAWDAGNQQPVLQRGDADVTADVSYAVVEFTGANWQIQRIEHTYTLAGTTETEFMTAIPAISQAFVHAQKRVGEGLSSIDEGGHLVFISSLGAVSFQLRDTAQTPADHVSVAWVIANTQTGNGAMVSYQSSGQLNNPDPEPATYSVAIGGTVNPGNASIFGTNHTAGTGTTYPRLHTGFTIASSTHYEIYRSDTNNDMDYQVEVVEWPVAETSIRQNYYRFYVDNDLLDPTDPWPVGAADLGENTSITAIDEPLSEGERVRLRMTLLINNASLPENIQSFKLQYGRRDTTCSAITELGWSDVGDPGSGAIWRGFNGTPVDGTALATSTPAPGTLNISVADVAGTYEEQNNTAINPFSVDLGQDIEYDWLIEHNGAVQRSDYCFRMIKSDNSLLDGYNNYPTLRTSGYTPISETWRWYDDETNVTPISPLAAEQVAPSGLEANNIVKLRTIVSEVENASGNNVKFALQYSNFADFRDGGFFLASSTACTASSTWCYADGAGTDNALIESAVLSTADSCVASVGNGCGTHNEIQASVSSLTQLALSNMEFEFTLEHRAARASGVYYFRLYDTVADEPVVASTSYPSIGIASPILVFTVEGVASGTVTEGITADVDTTPTTITFGSIPFDTEYEAVYRLHVDTSATEGFQLFMRQLSPLQNSYGTAIPAVSGSNASPVAWSTGCTPETTACFGYHAGDDTLANGSSRFAPNDSYAALTNTFEEVMFSGTPAETIADIVFKLQVREGQQAGDYQTEVIYLVVPSY